MAGLTRILVVDDHPVTAQGTASVLMGSGMEVLGTVNSIEAAAELALSMSPDVIVCDVMFGAEPLGLDLPPRIASLGVKSSVLLMSSYDAPYFVARAVRDGAAGYVSKAAPVSELLRAVQTVAAGGVAFLVSALRLAETHRAPSPRERDIIELVAGGAANGEIGLRLGITERTVEGYLTDLFVRYGVSSRTQLTMHSVRQGWLPSQALTPRRL